MPRAAPPPRRVFVTGMGAVTPFGVGLEPLWQAMSANHNAITPVVRWDTAPYTCRVAGTVPDVETLEGRLPSALRRKLDPYQAFAVVASILALEHAGLDPTTVDRSRFGVVAGSSNGGISAGLGNHTKFLDGGGDWRLISPFTGVGFTVNGVSAWPAIHLGLRGPNEAFSLTCASGNVAIGNGFRKIRDGYADRLLVGASDYLAEFIMAFFHKARAVARMADDPYAVDRLRAFDARRSGTILSEGAGMLLLESEEAAGERGAAIHAEVLGMGETCDAHNIVAPLPDGTGMTAAMRACLADAALAPEEIDYVSAHGTGTPFNDSTEVMALKEVLGPRAEEIPVSAPKSQLGHLIGASSAVEAIVAILGSAHGVVTPTLHLDEPDPACDLDHVPHQARPHPYRTILNNSFGFGGHNVVLALRAGSPD